MFPFGIDIPLSWSPLTRRFNEPSLRTLAECRNRQPFLSCIVLYCTVLFTRQFTHSRRRSSLPSSVATLPHAFFLKDPRITTHSPASASVSHTAVTLRPSVHPPIHLSIAFLLSLPPLVLPEPSTCLTSTRPHHLPPSFRPFGPFRSLPLGVPSCSSCSPASHIRTFGAATDLRLVA